jgi:hypothetical protein
VKNLKEALKTVIFSVRIRLFSSEQKRNFQAKNVFDLKMVILSSWTVNMNLVIVG